MSSRGAIIHLYTSSDESDDGGIPVLRELYPVPWYIQFMEDRHRQIFGLPMLITERRLPDASAPTLSWFQVSQDPPARIKNKSKKMKRVAGKDRVFGILKPLKDSKAWYLRTI